MSFITFSGPPASADAVHLSSTFNGSVGACQLMVLVASQTSLPFASPANTKKPPQTAETAKEAPSPFAFETKRVANISARALSAKDGLRVSFKHAACASSSLVAAATTAARIKLFAPEKDPASADWIERDDLLPHLMRLYGIDPEKADPIDATIADRLESCSLSWSDIWIDAENQYNKHARASFLAVGSKDGAITVWRFDSADLYKPIFQTSIKPQAGWATKTSWSQWVHVPGNLQYCYMISSYANGCVYAHLITFDAASAQLTSTTVSQLSLSDNRGASVIKFFKDPTLIRVAFTKGNTISVWTAPTITSITPDHKVTYLYDHPASSSTSPSNRQEHQLQQQGNLQKLQLPISMAVGGVTWSLLGDEIHVYTIDGKSFTIAVIPETVSGATNAGSNNAFETPPNENGGSSSSSTNSTFSGEDDGSNNNFGGHSVARNGVALVFLEDTTQQFYQEILGDPNAKGGGADDEAGGDEEGGGGAAAAPAGANGYGKQIRYYGAVASPNGLVDFVLYTISLSEGLEYRTGKTDNCHVLVHWNYKQGNKAVEDNVIKNVLGLVTRHDLLYRYSPAHLLWDVLGLMHQGVEDEVDVVIADGGLVSKLLMALKAFVVNQGPASGQKVVGSLAEQVAKTGDSRGNVFSYLRASPETLFSNTSMNSLRLQNYIYIHVINSTINKTELATALLANYNILLREYVSTILRGVQKYMSDPRILLSETDLLMLTLVSDHCLQHAAFMSDMAKQLVTLFILVKERNKEQHILSICDEYLLKMRAALVGSDGVVAGDSKEHCLACSGAIVFQSPWKAVCAYGHPW
ncbi:UNVERIFIED_CONTAM: hypothetical protein HDU68_002473, partial [Siphonaria sp. JEL0065]